MTENHDNRTRVGFISQWYPPERIWVPQAVASALRTAGYEVQVVTGTPHYPTGVVEVGYSPFRFTTEVIDGIQVHRTPEYPYRGTRPIRRLASYLSFALSSSYAVLRHLRQSDLLFVYSSPATAAIPAIVMRAVRGKPYILQVQDVWPDSVLDSGFVTGPGWKRLIHSVLGRFVNTTYEKADQIIVITDSAKSLLVSRGVQEDKISVIYNWASDPRLSIDTGAVSLRTRLGLEQSKLVFLYAGAIGVPQELEFIIDAFEMANISSRAALVIVGSGVKKVEVEQSASCADGVYVLDQVPIGQAAAWLEESDVGVVSLADTDLHRATFPSKIQFLCGIGKPLLVRAPGDASAFVNKTGIGIGIGSANLSDTAEAFRDLALCIDRDDVLEGMSIAAREIFELDFSEQVGTTRIDALLRKTMRRSNSHRPG